RRSAGRSRGWGGRGRAGCRRRARRRTRAESQGSTNASTSLLDLLFGAPRRTLRLRPQAGYPTVVIPAYAGVHLGFAAGLPPPTSILVVTGSDAALDPADAAFLYRLHALLHRLVHRLDGRHRPDADRALRARHHREIDVRVADTLPDPAVLRR